MDSCMGGLRLIGMAEIAGVDNGGVSRRGGDFTESN